MQVIIIIVSLLQIFFIKAAIGFTCKATPLSCNTPETPEYYWKDFTGEIPSDALPGGSTAGGSTTYIGQAYIKDREQLVVTIYRGCSNARASASNTELQPNKNIRILCSNNLSKFSWVPTTAETAHLITNCKLPLGGSEINDFLHIGRVNYDGALIVGKVFSWPVGHRGLWIPNESGHETNFKQYEMLAYNCTKSNAIGA